MRHPLAPLLLLTLLLVQSAGFGITLAWRTLAKEDFTTRFCINKAEAIPMCFGSCQIDEVTAETVHDDSSGMSAPGLPDMPVFRGINMWAGPRVQTEWEVQKPVVPHHRPDFYTSLVSSPTFRPPIA